MKRLILFSIACFFSATPVIVFAMGSANYKINADIVGGNGGIGSSDNYRIQDTLGEPVAGRGSSLDYSLQQGFQYMLNTGISLTIDSDTHDFGMVSPGASVQGQSILMTTTDSWGGYNLLISENHAMLSTDAVTTIPDFSCSVNSPCAWSGNGFGFTVLSGTNVESKWGTSPSYYYAAAPVSDTVFHTKNGYTSGGDQTTVGYDVNPPSSQDVGTYSNIITYTALAKL